jgi:hypothetical protein
MFWGRIFSSQSDCEKGSRALSTCIVVVQLTAGAIREIIAAVQTPTAGIQNTSAIIQVTPGALQEASAAVQELTSTDPHTTGTVYQSPPQFRNPLPPVNPGLPQSNTPSSQHSPALQPGNMVYGCELFSKC